MSSRLALCSLVTLAAAAVAAAADLGDTVTIAAESSVARWPSYQVSLAGYVSKAEEGQVVTVESKLCRARSFSSTASVTTTQGGAWSASVYVQSRTVFRAAWSGVRSRDVVVQARPHLVLGQISRRQFRAQLLLGNAANGKRLQLQRFESDGQAWIVVRTIVFRNRSGSAVLPQMTFLATVPKGSTLRLVLPRAQAQPCYLAGYSNILQT